MRPGLKTTIIRCILRSVQGGLFQIKTIHKLLYRFDSCTNFLRIIRDRSLITGEGGGLVEMKH